MELEGRKTDPATGWTLPFAVALVLALLADRFRGLFDAAVPLGHFRERAIGLTTVRGVDASPYVESYVVLYGSFAVLLAAALLAARWAGRRLSRRPDSGRIARELRLAARLAEVAAAAAVTAILLRRADLDVPVALLLQAVVLVVAFAAVKLAVLGRGAGAAAAVLADVDLVAAALFVPFSAVAAFQAVAGLPLGFDGLPAAAWPAVYAALAAAVLALAARRAPTVDGRARLVLASAPLAFIPAAVPFANELQYRFPMVAPRILAAAAIAALFGAACALAAVHRRGRWRPRPARVLALAVFPAFLAGNVLFTVHEHVLRFDQLDYFHLGETTLPTQQLFQHGRLPLLDLHLTHTFSDMVFQTLYTLVNGYRALDMLVWARWVPAVLAVVALYFFLARVTSPGFAVVAVAATPVLWTVSADHALALVPPIFLAGALRRPGVRRFALLWGSTAALGLWRLDLGLASAAAAVLVTVPWLARRRPGRLLPRVPAHRARAVAISLAATAGALLGAFAVAAVASGRAPVGTALSFFESYSHRLATRMRPEIVDDYGFTAALQYYVLPAVAAVVIARFLAARMAGRRTPLVWAPLAMAAAFSLAISVRSLERHSLVERFNPYLFALLAALLPLLFLRRRESAATRLAFLAVMVLQSLAALAPASFGVGRDLRLHLFADGGRLFETRTWRGEERRVVYPEERHRPLVAFLERNLAEGQTFFDFTNSPLLYVLANRLFPTHVIPNLSHVSEAVQERVVADLEALRATGGLPFVVFEQGDERWDDADGVPNEVRSYRVAELVYRRYRPLARVGPYEVWSDENVHAGTVLDFELDRRELALAALELHDVERLPPAADGARRFRTLGEDPWIAGLLALDEEVGAGTYATLELEYAASAPGFVQVFFAHGEQGFREEASTWAPLAARRGGGADRLTVALPAAAEPLRNLRLDPPPGLELEIRRAALLVAGEPIRPLAPDQVVQRFDLGRLPAVWGAFDPLAATDRTAVVATLAAAPFGLDVDTPAVFDFDPAIDKSSGSYLQLRLRPLAGGEVPRLTIRYGVARRGVLMNGFDLAAASLEDPGRGDRFDDHLVRLSTQWAWMSQPVDRLVLEATGPVMVESVRLRAGD
jgi:hypothetical protein